MGRVDERSPVTGLSWGSAGAGWGRNRTHFWPHGSPSDPVAWLDLISISLSKLCGPHWPHHVPEGPRQGLRHKQRVFALERTLTIFSAFCWEAETQKDHGAYRGFPTTCEHSPGDTKLVAVEARALLRPHGSQSWLRALCYTAAGEDVALPYQDHLFNSPSVSSLLYFSREYQFFCLQVSPASLLC